MGGDYYWWDSGKETRENIGVQFGAACYVRENNATYYVVVQSTPYAPGQARRPEREQRDQRDGAPRQD